MQNSEIKSAEQMAIESNAVEDARYMAESLSRQANENLCVWLSFPVRGCAAEIKEKERYEASDKIARKALNVYQFLTNQVYS